MAKFKNFGCEGVGDKLQYGKGGPHLRIVGGVLENRDPSDVGLVVMRGADPQGPTDFATRQFVESRGQGRYAVTGQIDGTAVPNTTVPGEVFIVTTSGGGYTINEMYRGDGLGGTNWVQIAYGEGAMAAITDPLLGGTIEFSPDRAYLWDLDANEWKDVGSVLALTGVAKTSVFELIFSSAPSNLIITPASPVLISEIRVKVNTPFNGTTPTARIETNSGDVHMSDSEIDLTSSGLYVGDSLDANSGVAINVIYTADSSTAGAATVYVTYSNV